MRSTRASASPPASTRSPPTTAARRSRACWPAPRSPRKRGPRRNVCCARRRRSDGLSTMAVKTKKRLPDVADLTKVQARVELTRLALELGGHDKRYYQDDAPSVSDAEYDELRKRFNAIEARFPEFVSSYSPSPKVGSPPSG